MDLHGKSVLCRLIERVQKSQSVSKIIIATSDSEEDNIIQEEAKKIGVNCYRGSQTDVLARFYGAAKTYKAQLILRITGDCPLIDPVILDNVIEYYEENNRKYDMCTNVGNIEAERTYPRGSDVEVFSFEALEKAYLHADKPYQREHVTPYFYDFGSVGFYKSNVDYSQYRFTLDTQEDYAVIKEIYGRLYDKDKMFYFNDIIRVFEESPWLSKMNAKVAQKKLDY